MKKVWSQTPFSDEKIQPMHLFQVPQLVRAGADPAARLQSRSQPLHYAIFSGYLHL